MSNLYKGLNNWKDSLDSLIGDTQKEIEVRRKQHHNAVEVRSDLIDLINYIGNTELPPSVQRALERCLKWNPFASE